jgi:hypothetical protein
MSLAVTLVKDIEKGNFYIEKKHILYFEMIEYTSSKVTMFGLTFLRF